MSYEDIISNLPKPQTLEEQYLYSIVCTVAKVDYNVPYNSPFWRKEKYLKALWQIAEGKVNEPVIPGDDTVSTDKIKNNAVTENKLAVSVANKLLGDGRVTEQMIADSSVTKNKLDPAVSSKLLSDGNVSTDMLASLAVASDKIANGAVSKAKLSDDVAAALLADNHVGIIPQIPINQVVETGTTLTDDILKTKINEIISALDSAGILV